MGVDLNCSYQVPIQVRFILHELTSPKKYHISDFWCHGYTVRQDYNHWEKKNKQTNKQRNSEKTQEQGHVFSKILGTFHLAGWSWKSGGFAVLPIGQADHAAQSLPRTLRGAPLPLQLSHLWFAQPEPFAQLQEDGTAFDGTIADPRLKQQGTYQFFSQQPWADGWYRQPHLFMSLSGFTTPGSGSYHLHQTVALA